MECYLFQFKVRDVKQVNDKATASATNLMNANFVADGGTNIMHPLSEVWHFEQPQLRFLFFIIRISPVLFYYLYFVIYSSKAMSLQSSVHLR